MNQRDAKNRISRMVEEYQDLIFSVAYRILGDYFTAQDIAQDCFLAAYKHLPQIEEGREKAWLCVCARNKSIDYLRKARHERPAEDEELSAVEASVDVEQGVLDQDMRKRLEQYCRRLKEPYAEVAYRYYCGEESIEEIAAALEQKPASVKTRLYRAREKLKQLYRREGML